MDEQLQRLQDIRWTFADDASAAARTLLQSGSWREQACAIKRNARRTIYRVEATPPMLVKVHHPADVRDRVKSLWRKAGLREFAAARRVAAAGVPTAPVVGCGVSGAVSFFAAVELLGTVKLRDAWAACLLDPSRRSALLDAVSRFAARFAAAGIRHWDMHPGNILVREAEGVADCFLIDLVGAVVTGDPLRVSHWDAIGWLTHLAPQITSGEVAQVLRASGIAQTGDAAGTVWRSLVREFSRRAATRWRGRRARLLSRSSICRRHDTEDGRWLLLTPFPLAAAEQAISQHRSLVRDNRMLKTDVKRRLARVALDPWLKGGTDAGDPHGASASDSRLLPRHLHQTSVVVKEFRRPKPLGRWAADCRSWFNHYRLAQLGLPATTALGWLKARDGRGYVVLTDVGQVNLREALAEPERQDRRTLLAAAGRLVAWLHQRAVFHRDLKATNFVVSDDPVFPVYLVDCDDVHFETRMTDDRRQRGLNQLLENLQDATDSDERNHLRQAYSTEMGAGTTGAGPV
jgi:tRNA A-37 threonylcarbamoyl transferase component Bud32